MAYQRGKCPVCSPDKPLALYTRDYVELRDSDTGEYGWRYCCTNCGRQRKPRAPRKVTLKDYTTEELTEQELAKLNRWNLARYHLLNPHGLLRGDLVKLRERIEANADLLKSLGKPGFILVYGYSDFHHDALSKLAFSKKAKVWNVNYHIAKLREQIEQGHAELDEMGAK